MEHELREGIRAFTFRDLAERDWPKPEHLIEPWFRTGESAMVWAAAGVGKTMLSLTLALMVAGGGKVAGWTSPGPWNVLIVDGEMRGADLAERLKLLADSVEGIDREAALDNIQIHPRTLQEPHTKFYDLGDHATQQALISHIQENSIDLLILDNVTTLTDTMGDENSVEHTKPVLKFLMDLKRINVAVLLVHHSSKGGNNYRGSTAFATTFEVIIGLTKPEGAPMGQTSFKLEFTKFRAKGDQSLAPRVFTLDGCKWHAAEDEDDETTRLIRAIETCKFTTQEEAGRSIGIEDKTKVSRLLKRAYGKGLVKKQAVRDWLDAGKEAFLADFEEVELA
jgi:RecA-family ATPase